MTLVAEKKNGNWLVVVGPTLTPFLAYPLNFKTSRRQLRFPELPLDVSLPDQFGAKASDVTRGRAKIQRKYSFQSERARQRSWQVYIATAVSLGAQHFPVLLPAS
jgi:hypothetical protein